MKARFQKAVLEMTLSQVLNMICIIQETIFVGDSRKLMKVEDNREAKFQDVTHPL